MKLGSIDHGECWLRELRPDSGALMNFETFLKSGKKHDAWMFYED